MTKSHLSYPSTPFWNYYSSATVFHAYESSGCMLAAVQMKYAIKDDMTSFAATALTDGPNDKGADLIYVDTEAGFAVIAQAYLRADFSNREASASKAAALNQTIAWILSDDEQDIPDSLQPQALELRQALVSGHISNLDILYVHNCIESQNVQNELKQTVKTTNSLLKQNFIDIPNHVNVQFEEIGKNKLEDLYDSMTNPIKTVDRFEVPFEGGYFEKTEKQWKALVTTVPAIWLTEQFKKHGSDFLSANVREYLGSRQSGQNINDKIKTTAAEEPNNFWAYNNGITILTNKYEIAPSGHRLSIVGASIINGAQTVGALSSANSDALGSVFVQVRFVVCSDEKVLKDIVRYNNTQNKILSPDYRSTDAVQTRIEKEFDAYGGAVTYSSRRGGVEDSIKRNLSSISSITAGQALSAFHGEPGIAYHKKTEIWESDDMYTRFFRADTTADNIFFAYSLMRSIQNQKAHLVSREKLGDLTESERERITFFRARGSIFVLLSAISSCLEDIIGKKVKSKFKIRFKKCRSFDDSDAILKPIVEACSAMVGKLMPAFASGGLRDSRAIDQAVKDFRSLIGATKIPNATIYQNFARMMLVD